MVMHRPTMLLCCGVFVLGVQWKKKSKMILADGSVATGLKWPSQNIARIATELKTKRKHLCLHIFLIQRKKWPNFAGVQRMICWWGKRILLSANTCDLRVCARYAKGKSCIVGKTRRNCVNPTNSTLFFSILVLSVRKTWSVEKIVFVCVFSTFWFVGVFFGGGLVFFCFVLFFFF